MSSSQPLPSINATTNRSLDREGHGRKQRNSPAAKKEETRVPNSAVGSILELCRGWALLSPNRLANGNLPPLPKPESDDIWNGKKKRRHCRDHSLKDKKDKTRLKQVSILLVTPITQPCITHYATQYGQVACWRVYTQRGDQGQREKERRDTHTHTHVCVNQRGERVRHGWESRERGMNDADSGEWMVMPGLPYFSFPPTTSFPGNKPPPHLQPIDAGDVSN